MNSVPLCTTRATGRALVRSAGGGSGPGFQLSADQGSAPLDERAEVLAEPLTWRIALGGALMLGSMLIVDTGPRPPTGNPSPEQVPETTA